MSRGGGHDEEFDFGVDRGIEGGGLTAMLIYRKMVEVISYVVAEKSELKSLMGFICQRSHSEP